VAGQLLQQRERHAELRERGVGLEIGSWNLLSFPFVALDLDTPHIFPDMFLQNALLVRRDPPCETAILLPLCIRILLLHVQDAPTEGAQKVWDRDRDRAVQGVPGASVLGYARCSGPTVHIRVRIRGVGYRDGYV
jgi:hypothetical protein